MDWNHTASILHLLFNINASKKKPWTFFHPHHSEEAKRADGRKSFMDSFNQIRDLIGPKTKGDQQ